MKRSHSAKFWHDSHTYRSHAPQGGWSLPQVA